MRAIGKNFRETLQRDAPERRFFLPLETLSQADFKRQLIFLRQLQMKRFSGRNRNCRTTQLGLHLALVGFDKLAERAVVGPFDLGREAAAGQLFRLQVVLQTLTTFSVPVATRVGACAVNGVIAVNHDDVSSLCLSG